MLPSNSEELVNKLIIRLGLENVADEFFKLSIDENSNKKKGMIPKHLPIFGNLRNVFFHNVDLNSVPKKVNSIPYNTVILIHQRFSVVP